MVCPAQHHTGRTLTMTALEKVCEGMWPHKNSRVSNLLVATSGNHKCEPPARAALLKQQSKENPDSNFTASSGVLGKGYT